jgi:hypothetical protein
MTSTAKVASVLGVSTAKGADPTSFAKLITDTPSPDSTTTSGEPSATIFGGVVQSLQLSANPPMVTCTFRGGSILVPNVRYLAGYLPRVNDVVRIAAIGPDHWIIGVQQVSGQGQVGLDTDGNLWAQGLTLQRTASNLGGLWANFTSVALYGAAFTWGRFLGMLNGATAAPAAPSGFSYQAGDYYLDYVMGVTWIYNGSAWYVLGPGRVHAKMSNHGTALNCTGPTALLYDTADDDPLGRCINLGTINAGFVCPVPGTYLVVHRAAFPGGVDVALCVYVNGQDYGRGTETSNGSAYQTGGVFVGTVKCNPGDIIQGGIDYISASAALVTGYIYCHFQVTLWGS